MEAGTDALRRRRIERKPPEHSPEKPEQKARPEVNWLDGLLFQAAHEADRNGQVLSWLSPWLHQDLLVEP